jgi:hypothetical protein
LPKELDVMKPFDFVEYQYERSKITNDTTFVTRFVRNRRSLQQNFKLTKTQRLCRLAKPVMFGRKALQQTHNISVSGGTQQTQYNLSGTYNNQDGILQYTQYKRGIINFRFDHQASESLKNRL